MVCDASGHRVRPKITGRIKQRQFLPFSAYRSSGTSRVPTPTVVLRRLPKRERESVTRPEYRIITLLQPSPPMGERTNASTSERQQRSALKGVSSRCPYPLFAFRSDSDALLLSFSGSARNDCMDLRTSARFDIS